MIKIVPLFAMGITAGALITLQSVLNAGLGKKTGNLGSVLILTVVSLLLMVALVAIFPGSANFKKLPEVSEWYLYAGGVLGIFILAAPIFLIPRVGATVTLSALVMGQLLLSVVFDHYGLLNSPRIEISLGRLAGVVLLIIGAILVIRK